MKARFFSSPGLTFLGVVAVLLVPVINAKPVHALVETEPQTTYGTQQFL